MRFDNEGWDPRFFVIQEGQALKILADNHFPLFNTNFHIGFSADNKAVISFSKPRIEVPSRFSCLSHQDEQGQLLISSHKWAGVSNKNGKIKFPTVPPGKHVFKLWHHSVGWIKRVSVDQSDVTLEKGELSVEIPEQANVTIEITIILRDKQEK